MNFEELQKTWAKQSVAGARPQSTELQRLLETEVRQRSRKIRRVIGVAGFLFVIGWATALTAHFTAILRFTPVSLATFLILTGYDVVFLIFGLRAYHRMKQEAASMGATLLDSTRSSLRAVNWQVRDCVLFGYALGVALAFQAGVSLVRYWLGDVAGGVALANVGFVTLLVAAVAFTVRRYYRRELLPRRAELTRELFELDGE